MLQEPDEIALKRKRCRELLRAYQQAFKVNNTSLKRLIQSSVILRGVWLFCV